MFIYICIHICMLYICMHNNFVIELYTYNENNTNADIMELFQQVFIYSEETQYRSHICIMCPSASVATKPFWNMHKEYA